MKILPAFIDNFFFGRRSATPFGLMRIAWAVVVLLFFLFQWKDVAYYYSDEGLLPLKLMHLITRSNYHFSLLKWLTTPDEVFAVYLLFLGLLTCMAVGIFPRITTILSVLLLFSFHERSSFTLGGGDTLLRNIGFVLMLAPGIDAVSLSRARKQWKVWKKKQKWLPEKTMPAWPYRLLLWQMLVVYITSLWYKLLGTMWTHGTATIVTLHHPIYSRLPRYWADNMTVVAAICNQLTLLLETLWIFMLVPKGLVQKLPRFVPRIPLKRILLLGGIALHGGILLLMDAGVFSLAVFAAYVGLVDDADLEALRRLFRGPKSTAVLYDGHCGLCRRSVFVLHMLDAVHQLQLVDFRKATERNAVAPNLTLNALDRALHIKLPDGSFEKGFDAFRALAWKLPPLWIAIPVLYVPGVPIAGRRLYTFIAKRRKKCTHESCGM